MVICSGMPAAAGRAPGRSKWIKRSSFPANTDPKAADRFPAHRCGFPFPLSHRSYSLRGPKQRIANIPRSSRPRACCCAPRTPEL